jgi:redox-sensitive bicupin YhaK (pirin superfamily)
MERMNPFIMLDYAAPHYFPPTEVQKGVGVHPHKGFETVTIAYKGRVAHHDSAGNSGIIGEGDVQWMTAASGVLHKEYHEKEFSKAGGIFSMVQLWVNLPAADKLSKPKYQEILNTNIPKVELPNDSGIVEVIAGNYEGTKGAASTFTEVHAFNVKLNAGGTATFSFNERNNTGVLVIAGSITVNEEQKLATSEFGLLSNDGETFTLSCTEDATILILSGEPILEPIAAYGPFVMNTKQELMDAFHQFERGEFGELE